MKGLYALVRSVPLWIAALGAGGAAAQSSVFTYQGQLLSAGMPVNGSVDFNCSLWDAPTDGAQIGVTLNLPGITVTEGLFTLPLDFGDASFTGGQRWLELSVDGTPLAPRQELTATPYALHAARPWRTIGDDIYYVDGRVGIGTMAPTARLEIAGTPGLDGIMFPDGTMQTTAAGTTSSPWQWNGTDVWYAGGGVGVTGASSPYPSGKGVFLEGGLDDRANIFAFDYDIWQALPLVLNAPGGNVGIGTPAPAAKLHVAGGSDISVFGTTVSGRGISGWVTGDFGGIGVSGDHVSAGNYGLLGTVGAGVTGVASVVGNVGGVFGNTAPGGVALRSDGTLEIAAAGNGTELLRLNSERPWLFRQVGSGAGAHLQLKSTTGLKEFQVASASGASIATFFADDADPRMQVPKLNVSGTTRTAVLEITGADLAERFPVSDSLDAVTPGLVLEIDPDIPGNLRTARGAYNRRVAGVVSGAGGIPLGAVLGNLPGLENSPPIALSGRVWVRCDASSSPIAPGDLLTTSNHPGHAMRADDHARAQGAILGKAMTALPEGTGLVLVLVSLQ